jgi:hypothetical protein
MTAANWSAEELDRIGGAEELEPRAVTRGSDDLGTVEPLSLWALTDRGAAYQD